VEPRILIASADSELRVNLSVLLASHPIMVTAGGPIEVLNAVVRHPSLRVLLLVDAGAPEQLALNLLDAALARRPDLKVLFLSRLATVEHATSVMRHGAADFVPVPYSDEALAAGLAATLADVGPAGRPDLPVRGTSAQGVFDRIVSRSACMQPLFERAMAVSRNDTPVLISGETGTGKELVARAIHAGSRRATRPFVPVNCAALPRDLFESELFGHRRGAFSGAHKDHAGLFVAADGGTLFLDEISELPAEAQPKLLRVLQDGEVRPVGGLDSRKVDVRIIAATNRTLAEMSRGLIRQDLFFRLSVVVLDVPPLRARLDDLPLLVDAFIARLKEQGVPIDGVDAVALEMLADYAFPGNVRELENLVEGIAAVQATGHTTITAGDVRAWLRRRGLGAAVDSGHDVLPVRLDELEAWAIGEALERTRGNKRRAAQLLGISRDTLYRKLEQLAGAPAVSESRTLPFRRR
jgi:DNA-binding NtrC family response regulator